MTILSTVEVGRVMTLLSAVGIHNRGEEATTTDDKLWLLLSQCLIL